MRIWRCFHLVDNKSVSPGERKKDKFWKIRPLITALNFTFQLMFTCYQWLSGDEMTQAFKGRHSCKQYRPALIPPLLTHLTHISTVHSSPCV